MNNVLLHESRAEIPQRSLGETLSVSCILSLEIYAHSSAVAIIKQLQFHMAASFEIEEEKGGGKSSIFKKGISVTILMFPSSFLKMLSRPAGHVFHSPDHKNISFSHHWNENEKKMDQLLGTC